MPSVFREHIALDTAWSHAVDCDTAFSKVGRERLDESNDRHLRPIVQRMIFNPQQSRSNRRHKDNSAVVLDVLIRRLSDEKLRPRIQVENMIVLLLGNLLRLVPRLCARVRHDNIDLVKRLLGFCEKALDLGELGDVGADGDGLGAVVEALDDLDDFLGGAFARDVVYDDGGAALAELDGAPAADASAAAGDERDFAFERGGGDVDDHFGGVGGFRVKGVGDSGGSGSLDVEVMKWEFQ